MGHGSFNLSINFSKINKFQLPRTKIKTSFQFPFFLSKRSCATLEFHFGLVFGPRKSAPKKVGNQSTYDAIRKSINLHVDHSFSYQKHPITLDGIRNS